MYAQMRWHEKNKAYELNQIRLQIEDKENELEFLQSEIKFLQNQYDELNSTNQFDL
jgi:cell division protein FtsB